MGITASSRVSGRLTLKKCTRCILREADGSQSSQFSRRYRLRIRSLLNTEVSVELFDPHINMDICNDGKIM